MDSTQLISYSPLTGEEIGRYHRATAEQIDLLVARAKAGSQRWQAIGHHGRRAVLKSWAELIRSRREELALLIHQENGKPISDANLEITLALDHLHWAATHSKRYLKSKYRFAGALMLNSTAKLERAPLGVVGVIGPWNFPIFTPMGSIAYALAAGNAVVFKPSEYTPGVGQWLGETFNEVAPQADIFFAVTGDGETGAALARSAVNKLAFTGSSATAKKVAATCAARLTPVILECGGTDPAIIDEDADLERAAESVLWGAMNNAGQLCIGIERVYVHEKVVDKFCEIITALGSSIEPGKSYGPSTMPSQLKVIDAHIQDAADRGAHFLLGSRSSVQPPFVMPTIMTNVPEESTAISEETFGPTLTITTVSSMTEAVQLSNASKYGLGASVWSKKNADLIASNLECGMVSVNSVITFAGVASLPFGGVKESGYGRIHGREGLLEFTYPRSVVRERFHLPMKLLSFSRTEKTDKLLVKISALLLKL